MSELRKRTAFLLVNHMRIFNQNPSKRALMDHIKALQECVDALEIIVKQEPVAQIISHPRLCGKFTASLAYDAATHLTNWLDMDLCECEGGHTCGYTEVRRTRDALLVVAAQQSRGDL